MAKSIKTKFYSDATAKCSNCGSIYTLGMTVETLSLEICGNCHPFYTGQESLVDTAGRIEKFQARVAKASQATAKTATNKTRKSTMSLADFMAENTPKAPTPAPAKKAAKPTTDDKQTQPATTASDDTQAADDTQPTEEVQPEPEVAQVEAEEATTETVAEAA
jgi:large subunit ribosomal protein L31